jgi:hypothetical protein
MAFHGFHLLVYEKRLNSGGTAAAGETDQPDTKQHQGVGVGFGDGS